MYGLLRPLLFSLPAETAHGITLRSLDIAASLGMGGLLGRGRCDQPVSAMGLQFPSAIGLAAGLDKDGRHLKGLAALGFGFLEVGTVTPLAQAGNPKPRMFRVPKAQAIINRMGFNNAGLQALQDAVAASAFGGVLGINIGKNKDTAAERALDDYLIGLRGVHSLASYITVNLSSPNTPGLRDLQFGEPLEQLLAGLASERDVLADAQGRRPPMLVKIAPDIADTDLAPVIDALLRNGVDGVIATNTTVDHSAVEALPHGGETGGVSGAPLTARAETVLRKVREVAGSDLTLIAAGGIMSAADATARLEAGADLLQIYSGLVYRGPRLIREIEDGIRAR